MVNDAAFDYLMACKAAYQAESWPGHVRGEFGRRIELASKKFVDQYGVASFSGFLKEYQYLVDLWTAHMIVESDTAERALFEKAMDVIKRYASAAISPAIRACEREWLDLNFPQGLT